MAPHENIDTVSKAAAYGEYTKLQQFLDAQPACVNETDASGYYPLQWAALNNRVAEATFLLQRGALVNAVDHTGQTSLHWASVRGSLPVLETLLRNGGSPDIQDNRGYTAAHVAAQYGQTAVLYHLALKWGVDMDTPDADGRTPLHWAAYKGYADTLRLLLVLEASCTLADKEGCTALHWAAIKGNGEACTVLLQGGSVSVLTYKDVTGSTPAQLAVEKGHRYLGLHLAEYKQKHEGSSSSWWGKSSWLSWLTGTQLCPVIWLIGLSLMALYSHKVMLPGLSPPLMAWSWSVMLCCSLGLFFLYKTTTADPGFIPSTWTSRYDKRGADSGCVDRRESDSCCVTATTTLPTSSLADSKHHLLRQGPGPGHQHSQGGPGAARGGSGAGEGGKGVGGGSSSSSSSNPRLKALDSPALWAGNWHQLCVSCHIVRPLRAKHCSVTDRCIEVFDHYCPWVGNAIGKGNRHWFILFLWLELYGLATSAIITCIIIHAHAASETWDTSRMPGLPPSPSTGALELGRLGLLLYIVLMGAAVALGLALLLLRSGQSAAWMVAFVVADLFVGVSVAALAVAQASQIARNVTTNELANWHRYKYLQTADGSFHNPFSKGKLPPPPLTPDRQAGRQAGGIWANCAEAFNPGSTPMAPVYLSRDAAHSPHTGCAASNCSGCSSKASV
ncbi:hypothetical protein QJQ45_013141 [Haematococcus lacustris]|nr:hypothetical protein QJQ45_013141 [Haematococcus lacustris]